MGPLAGFKYKEVVLKLKNAGFVILGKYRRKMIK
jgi:hypothetical protein